jgi:hypothetical protein
VSMFAGLLDSSSSSFCFPLHTGWVALCSTSQQNQVQILHPVHFLAYHGESGDSVMLASATIISMPYQQLMCCAGFTEEEYSINWVSHWVKEENVQYDWTQSSILQTCVVGLSTITVLDVLCSTFSQTQTTLHGCTILMIADQHKLSCWSALQTPAQL